MMKLSSLIIILIISNFQQRNPKTKYENMKFHFAQSGQWRVGEKVLVTSNQNRWIEWQLNLWKPHILFPHHIWVKYIFLFWSMFE